MGLADASGFHVDGLGRPSYGGFVCRDSMKKHGDRMAAVLFVIGNLLGAMPQVSS
ncbi:hypothetical protein RISK_001722 [Rhodopirellula islandica]|uniref:Uncharacterized protein n=1 Tax=Rhodopirellula islandica TaxID=595434 RepID=A0A0J1BIY1_RHOIS|nr:hypothetical protein RISK_001722 [Rhodopirellula islandica]